jgi:hypothetical protein
MSEALQVKKIYVDSRYRTTDSVSDSNFRIQLGRNIYLPDNCIMHIENCVIPHSWYTIETGLNDTMYLRVNSTCKTATIPSANYTGNELTIALQAALNVAFSGVFTVSYSLNTNKITISGNSAFKILTDSELATYLSNTWTGPSYDPNSPNSCNDIITNRTIKDNSSTSPFVSGMINLQGFRAVYLSSSNLSNFNTLGPRGENDIIKKVMTTSDFGYLIIDQVVSDHDWLDCSRMTLNTIDFQIKDVKGNYINFRDSPVSFTIVFSIKQ